MRTKATIYDLLIYLCAVLILQLGHMSHPGFNHIPLPLTGLSISACFLCNCSVSSSTQLSADGVCHVTIYSTSFQPCDNSWSHCQWATCEWQHDRQMSQSWSVTMQSCCFSYNVYIAFHRADDEPAESRQRSVTRCLCPLNHKELLLSMLVSRNMKLLTISGRKHTGVEINNTYRKLTDLQR